MNDILLISTNALIDAYETSSLKELEIGREEIVDTHYISNLHKLEMLGIGLQVGNGLKVLKTVESVFEEEEELQITKTTNYADCNLDISKENNQIRNSEFTYDPPLFDPVENVINDGFKVINNKTNNFLNDLMKDYKKADDYLRDCLNCKPNFDPKYQEVNFEFSFNFANFLKQWDGLLNEIKASLDPTKAFKDLCNLFDIISRGTICISSWPLILLSVPVVIGDLKAQMLDVRLNLWSGLGFIVNPIMSITANIIEYLKNLFLPALDCLDRGLSIIKSVISSAEGLTTNIVRQGTTVVDTFNNFKNIDIRLPNNTAPKKENLTIDVFKNRPSVEFSLPKDIFKNTKERFQLSDFSSEISSSGSNQPSEQTKNLEGIYNLVNLLHQGLIVRAKDIIEETFGTILYTFKSLSQYLSEPLKANFNLLGELKVAFSLFSLIQLIIGLINNGMASCKDIQSNKAKFSSILPDFFDDIQVFAESPSEEELVLVDNFNGNNKRSIKPQSCGDLFANLNTNEKNLDNIYDIISMNNR